MGNLTQRNAMPITPSQVLFVTAMLAVSGASEGTRRMATDLFERGALSVVWAVLSRHTESRVSWLRLASVTHEATRHFLRAWPASGSMCVASMLSMLETCARDVARGVADTAPQPPTTSPWGVLTLLTHDERLQLLQCVEVALAAVNRSALFAAVESEGADTLHHRALGDDVINAVDQLESLLLGSCVRTLGTPAEVGRWQFAA